MTLFYSASSRGFYDSAVGGVVPVDAVEITTDTHAALMLAQAQGDRIEPDAAGKPIAVPPAALTLAQVQASLCAAVDAAVDDAYVAIGGPSPGRLAEYQQANNDATAYKAAGYAGVVPQTVQCWATASGITPKAAADSILATAVQWMAVLNGVRSARLIGKGTVNAATTVADAEAAAATAIANVTAAAGGA
jgi:hypothetical protein